MEGASARRRGGSGGGGSDAEGPWPMHHHRRWPLYPPEAASVAVVRHTKGLHSRSAGVRRVLCGAGALQPPRRRRSVAVHCRR